MDTLVRQIRPACTNNTWKGLEMDNKVFLNNTPTQNTLSNK
jgi:hypothetical protein